MGERREKNKHAADNGKAGIFGKLVIITLLFIIIVVISTFIWYNSALSGPGSESEEVTFEISLGSGTSKIASILKENGVIKSEFAFKLYAKLNGVSNFQAGKYTITKNMSVPEIAKSLQSGKVFKDTNFNITFVEGKTIPYVVKTIAENTNNSEQDVYALLADEEYLDSLIDEYWFLTDEIKNENLYYSLEGYLFPDTYTFEDKDVRIRDIIKTMLDQMGKVLDKYKTDIQRSKYSVHEILSLASIIENEAIFDKDRKDVSSVLYNRLEVKMSLGSDVTTYYANKIELGERDLYKSEINKENPYNTRGPNMAGKIPVRTYFSAR